MDRKNNLNLLKFPDQEKYIAQERIKSALKMLETPEDEYIAFDQIICAMYNHLKDYEETDLILYNLIIVRTLIQEFYND